MYVIKPEIHVQEERKGITFFFKFWSSFQEHKYFGTLFDQNQPFFKVFKNTIFCSNKFVGGYNFHS
jgi:hypothetical protein